MTLPNYPAHRYAEHVETVLEKPEPPRRRPWLRIALCAVGVLVSLAFLAWSFYSPDITPLPLLRGGN